MKVKVPERLESERLIIRPFVQDDLDGFYSFMSDEDAPKYILFSEDETTIDETPQSFLPPLSNYDGRDQIYALAVATKNENSFIGSVGIGPDFSGDKYQIYWNILPQFWGKGLATEAVIRFMDYLLREVGLGKLVAYSHPDNIASAKVAEKAGMQNQGTILIDGLDHEPLYFEVENDSE
ncbi:ribosomal-protein-alanine N-acetyltransferase [Methanohalophilus levihalophilus]|uniref:GNAT family N-acetyltransferase n=1 Tax=Methanohalophilus levihalophilus TaxID=1431282 RepID=UPI001AE11B88|nr:GNAT family N-acetyltransferase [Methanohalophilus levihalophilus]MBP2029494.1 ribosomal-protein-alanine N-acetyltransferase [Methanohalophilus levihalophilus]